jgi:hypothetical protein
MKFVRSAETPFEQNLSLVQEEDQLFFIATRAINPRQELRVTYSPEYARERNLPVPEVLDEGLYRYCNLFLSVKCSIIEDDENLWPCFECTKKLQSSEELQTHLNEHDDDADLRQRQPGTDCFTQINKLLT